jgi:hypothetical protein
VLEQYFFALSIKVLQHQNIMQTGQNALQDLKEEQDCCAHVAAAATSTTLSVNKNRQESRG